MCHCPKEFISTLFLLDKNDGHKFINLNNLNAFIPYYHFGMEGLHLIKNILQEMNFMSKVDLKDAFISVPINK